MYETLLRKIAAEVQAKFGVSILNEPCSDSSIQRLMAQARAKFEVEIPEAYLNFLRITDGYDWNSLEIYGGTRRYHPIASGTGPVTQRFSEGFIEANEDYRAGYEPCANYLFFGRSSVDAYVYNLTAGEFQIVDKVSLEVFDSFDSFDAMLIETLKVNNASLEAVRATTE